MQFITTNLTYNDQIHNQHVDHINFLEAVSLCNIRVSNGMQNIVGLHHFCTSSAAQD